MEKFASDKKIRTILALLCCCLWGSAFPCVKLGYQWLQIEGSGSQILFAGYRFFLAGIFTFLLGCMIEKRILKLRKSSLVPIVRQGLLQTTLQYILFYMGMAYTTGTKGSVINACNGFVTIIVAHFVFADEKMKWNKILGCILGIAGAIAVNLSAGGLGSGVSFRGEGLIVLCTVTYGVTTVILKKISRIESPMTITAYQLLIGGFGLILVGGLFGGTVTGFSMASTFLLLYMALLSTLAFSIWTILLRYNPVGEIAIFGFMIPVFGVLLSGLILGEEIWQVKNFIGLALVSMGIIVTNKIKVKK